MSQTSTETIPTTQDYKVADLALADWVARKSASQKEMPGLAAIREKHAADKPLAGVRILARCT